MRGQHIKISDLNPTIFGKCYFGAEKCFDGIQALRHYRYDGLRSWAACIRSRCTTALARGGCIQDSGGDDSRAGAEEGDHALTTDERRSLRGPDPAK
jgi:hypothetical protein